MISRFGTGFPTGNLRKKIAVLPLCLWVFDCGRLLSNRRKLLLLHQLHFSIVAHDFDSLSLVDSKWLELLQSLLRRPIRLKLLQRVQCHQLSSRIDRWVEELSLSLHFTYAMGFLLETGILV